MVGGSGRQRRREFVLGVGGKRGREIVNDVVGCLVVGWFFVELLLPIAGKDIGGVVRVKNRVTVGVSRSA